MYLWDTTLDVTVNDGIETTTSGVDIEVMGLFFDDFSTNLSVWTTSYSDAWIASGIAHITGNRSGYYGTLYYASPIYIPPEYTLQGKVARVSSFSGDDFYALYAKVNDTGSITIKYWCFVIEPSKANENWALICFVASATSGDWALLAQDSFGESSLINTQPNEWNNLSWKVEEDKTVILQVNKRHLYQSDEITNIENSFGVTITMDLVRGGARTKYQKEILLDDAIVITPPSPLNQKSGVTRLEKDNQLFENDSEASLHSLDISKLKTLREVLNNMY